MQTHWRPVQVVEKGKKAETRSMYKMDDRQVIKALKVRMGLISIITCGQPQLAHPLHTFATRRVVFCSRVTTAACGSQSPDRVIVLSLSGNRLSPLSLRDHVLQGWRPLIKKEQDRNWQVSLPALDAAFDAADASKGAVERRDSEFGNLEGRWVQDPQPSPPADEVNEPQVNSIWAPTRPPPSDSFAKANRHHLSSADSCWTNSARLQEPRGFEEEKKSSGLKQRLSRDNTVGLSVSAEELRICLRQAIWLDFTDERHYANVWDQPAPGGDDADNPLYRTKSTASNATDEEAGGGTDT